MWCVFAVASAADASSRPNALDRRIDAIPASALLSQPATTLVDPARQVAALELNRWRVTFWCASLGLQIVVLLYFWRRGSAARLRNFLRGRLANEFAVRFVFGASLALAAKLAALLPAFADYRIERTMLLSTELLRGWASGWLGGTILAMLLAGFAAAIVLRLADVTHQWYMYTIAAIFAVTFAAAILNPLVSRGFPNIPLDARHAATIQSLERANGVSVDVREFSVGDRTPPSEALLLGLGPTVRLMVSDLLVATATPAEFRFAVERQLAHVRRGDPARDAFMQALLLVFGTALAVFVADRVGFRRDDDPVSRLALVGALLACVYVLAAPLRTSFERGLESRADSEAAATIGDRTGAIREIVRSVDQRLAPLCPGVLDRAILADRDAAGARISALQDRPNVCP